MIFDKKNIPVYFFVGGSLTLFFIILTTSLLLVLKSNLASFSTSEKTADRYDFKDYEPGDPYVSKRPGLDDLLAGPIISANDPSIGPDGAPVRIVVFSDFACPFCQEQMAVLGQALDAYPDQVRLIRKDYPETEAESVSFQAAVAGRCAAEQGRFWDYHDHIAGQTELTHEALDGAPDALRLDRKRFQACRDADPAWHLVLDNMEEANALDISGVPFIYVNKQEFLGGVTPEDLKAAIETELDKTND